MIEGVEFDEPPEVVDVNALDTVALSTLYNDIREELMELEEMLEPKSDRGRELHSIRAACVIEMRKRGMR